METDGSRRIAVTVAVTVPQARRHSFDDVCAACSGRPTNECETRARPRHLLHLRDPDVMSLYQDRGGVIWVGTRDGGASHWNPNSWLLGHYRSAAFGGGVGVNAFADDGAGTVWVGTSAGLVEIDTRTGRERHHGRGGKDTLALADERVMALLFDRRSALWVGTMTGGLQRFDPVRRVARSAGSSAATPANVGV